MSSIVSTLIEKIRQRQQLEPDGNLPVVSLEEFFVGNDELGSIGCNLPEQLWPDDFFKILREIRSRPQVQDLLVEINEVLPEPEWPFADTVYILSSASIEEIRDWTASLSPDEVITGWRGTCPTGYTLRAGMTVYTVWWD